MVSSYPRQRHISSLSLHKSKRKKYRGIKLQKKQDGSLRRCEKAMSNDPAQTAIGNDDWEELEVGAFVQKAYSWALNG